MTDDGRPLPLTGRSLPPTERPSSFAERPSPFTGRPSSFAERPSPFTGRPLPFTGRHTELERLRGGLRRPGCRGVVITGEGGVGKSRLAVEFADEVAARHRTVRLPVSEAASHVPLAAFAPHLTGPALPGELGRHFQELRQLLAVPAGRPRTLLLVDGIHHLDDSSLTLLSALATDAATAPAPGFFLVATLPQGADWPEALRALWHQDAVEHLRVGPLDRAATARLLADTLGAPVTAPAVRALWEAGRGNALWTREILRAAVREGTLRPVDDVWCLTGPLDDALLDAPAEGRFRGIPEDRRTLLRLLALCGPLGLADALARVTPEALAALEEEHLVVVTEDDRRSRVQLAHPWHALLLRRGTPRLLARALLLEQAGRLREHGARRHGDALSLARWELDATGTADPELLVRAAGHALDDGDVDTMCRLARAALARGPHVVAGLLLGEGLGQRGEFTESIPVLERAFDEARSPGEVESAAAALSQHHLYGLGDAPAALGILDRAADRIGARPVLTACRATLLSAVGRNDEAADVLALAEGADPKPGDGGDAWTQADVLLLQAHLRVRLAAGRVDEAVRTGRHAYAVQSGLADRWTAYYPARSLYLVAAALLESGRLDEAERTALEGQEATRDAVPALTVWFAWVRGRIALERGLVTDALAHFREARALARHCGQPFAEQRALAGLVLAAAQTGRIAPEAEALAPAPAPARASGAVAGDAPGPAAAVAGGASMPARPPGADVPTPVPPPYSPLCQVDTLRAHGWVRLLRGADGPARELMLGAARAALARGEATVATALLHDVLRWGSRGSRAGAGAVAAELTAATALVQGSLAELRGAHAAATAPADGPDPEALEAVAERMGALGLHLYAAEAFGEAAGAWRRRGRTAGAARAAARSLALRGRCQEAATPALAGAAAAVPLSARERDIALMAARGRTSREIAEAYVLSVRTVENHLGRIYRKLGVSGRADLADVLLA
ncbi:helix-turn-helix transcriptional regulator [Streptomyces litmocidini]|uniref:helix-turn-helix transcriptional regulator n=1 Tax=Streptomyces litmocidini TaxID=67318 RepID=UPI00167E2409|nr:LuxR family transcriptional regulator [Streptomyces litmocidini]